MARKIIVIVLTISKYFSDICFIENTIEAALGLFNDTNVLVRMKVSWSLANITDVVVMNM